MTSDTGSSVPAQNAAPPLDGLRVIEVSSFVAAPLGGTTLAQLGAEVIRIDPIGGASDRGRWPVTAEGTSLYWAGLNKGKRSITVDFRSPAGQDLIIRLIDSSGADGGILLTNAVGRGWLDYEHLRQTRPDLIEVVIQGHRDGSAAVDYTVNAGLGLPFVTGPEGMDVPVNHMLPAWDIACGLHAVIAVLAAERRRRATGRGELVSIALYDVALALVSHLGFLAEAQVNGVERRRIGNHLYGGFGCDFATKDGGRVMVVALTKRQWRDLIDVTGTSDLFDRLAEMLGADFTTDDDRFRHREVIVGLLRPWFLDQTLGEVESALGRTTVLSSPYRSFRDLVGEGLPALLANPMMAMVEQAGVGAMLAAGSPMAFAASGRVPVRAAPRLGADTGSVLRELLAMSDDDVAALRGQGVVGGGRPDAAGSPDAAA